MSFASPRYFPHCWLASAFISSRLKMFADLAQLKVQFFYFVLKHSQLMPIDFGWSRAARPSACLSISSEAIEKPFGFEGSIKSRLSGMKRWADSHQCAK
ncbi:hypothetical protein NL64_08855 [Pseudomonas fluorescens]|jgi:hypothetical protein|nr:hypothetical protein NL64_08855 [Pseudomonas fluorescens]